MYVCVCARARACMFVCVRERKEERRDGERERERCIAYRFLSCNKQVDILTNGRAERQTIKQMTLCALFRLQVKVLSCTHSLTQNPQSTASDSPNFNFVVNSIGIHFSVETQIV